MIKKSGQILTEHVLLLLAIVMVLAAIFQSSTIETKSKNLLDGAAKKIQEEADKINDSLDF